MITLQKYRCVQVAGFLHGKKIFSIGNQIKIIPLTFYGLRSLSLMTNFYNNSEPHAIFLKYISNVKPIIRSFVQGGFPHVSLMSAAITFVMSNDAFTISIMAPGTQKMLNQHLKEGEVVVREEGEKEEGLAFAQGVSYLLLKTIHIYYLTGSVSYKSGYSLTRFSSSSLLQVCNQRISLGYNHLKVQQKSTSKLTQLLAGFSFLPAFFLLRDSMTCLLARGCTLTSLPPGPLHRKAHIQQLASSERLRETENTSQIEISLL